VSDEANAPLPAEESASSSSSDASDPPAPDGGAKDQASTEPTEQPEAASGAPEPAEARAEQGGDPVSTPAEPKPAEPVSKPAESKPAESTPAAATAAVPLATPASARRDTRRVLPPALKAAVDDVNARAHPQDATGKRATALFEAYMADPSKPMTLAALLQAPSLRFLLRIPLKKMFIWACFIGLIWLLRDFFGLIFLTFVISYITTTIVEYVSQHFSSRKVPVLLVYSAIVGILVFLGYAAVTRAAAEGQSQLAALKSTKNPKAFLDARLDDALGRQRAVESGAAQAGGVFGAVYSQPEHRTEPGGLRGGIAYYLDDAGINSKIEETLKDLQQKYLVPGATTTLKVIWKGVLFLFLALIFSFMIVWDAPKLGQGLHKLEGSRIGEVWSEVAPSIATFARLLGKAFEAQTLIAIVNTIFTATGMWILGIPGIGFLSVIVFVCSFIPVVGVFASTVPICAVALSVQPDQAHRLGSLLGGGIGLSLGVVVMVILAHMIEAYILNPRIYGHHMKLHPVAVLIVLFLAEHLIGVWGLILGVPLTTYVWRHLIHGEEEHIYEPEEAEAGTLTVAVAGIPGQQLAVERPEPQAKVSDRS
jgi:predicted PurR-regulated permease PerM